MKRKIGMLGGTFDPPHNGHLLIAEQAREQLGLEEVWFVLSNIPPHKQKTSTTNADRLAMLTAATAGNPHFSVCTIELERSGPSYTIDTVLQLTGEYPGNEFYFIIGGDMVEYLPNWHRAEELVKLIRFAGVRRSGYSVKTPYPVELVDIPMFDVSSSLIRRNIKLGRSVRYLLPEAVLNYIEEKQLYGD